jgi:diguanylate cyclase (GGDEF)-like protein/PAS domain S-box-containing protein
MTRTLLLMLADAGDANAVRRWMAESGDGPFDVQCVSRCSDGVRLLGERRGHAIDAVVLDMSLPDVEGIGAFEQVHGAAPEVPVLVLARRSAEDVARRAVLGGAQDYLLMEHLGGYSLPKAVSGMLGRAAHAQAVTVKSEWARVALDSIGDAVVSTDLAGNVTYLNPVAESMAGWSTREAYGRPLREVLHIVDADSRQPPADPVAAAMLHDRPATLSANCVLISRDGRESAIEDTAAPIHDRCGGVAGAVVVFHDVSAARAAAARMSFLAQHDPLTGLPNRMLLGDRLTQAIAAARRHQKSVAVLFLDVDRFKHINDSLGHAAGDQLLRSIASRLAACLRASDTVGRMGGDEFVILLAEVARAADATIAARKILAAMRAPHRVGQQDLRITVSLGCSIYPGDGADAESLLKNADIALFQAKARGQGKHQLYGPDSRVSAGEVTALQDERPRRRGPRAAATKPTRAAAGDQSPS